VHCAVNASFLLGVARALKASGLQAAGFDYVNSDDCWMAVARGPDGRQVADPEKFPGGFAAHVDALHALGFKAGLYTSKSPLTCQKRAASCGHEAVDAATWASWGVDYVKEDSCNAPQDHPTAFAQYAAMRDGIAASGRPMFFSLCGWESWCEYSTRASAAVSLRPHSVF